MRSPTAIIGIVFVKEIANTPILPTLIQIQVAARSPLVLFLTKMKRQA